LNKILIMISGRGSNMEAILKNIQKGCLSGICEVKAVFSNNLKAPGLKIAENYQIPTKTIGSKGKKRSTYNNLLKNYLLEVNADLIVLAGYMKILPKEIIQKFPGKIINIHPADTALHQGLHGYEWAYENKLNSTAITVHFVDEGLDTGDVIQKKTVDISECKRLEEIEQKGLKIEHELYSECIKKVITDF